MRFDSRAVTNRMIHHSMVSPCSSMMVLPIRMNSSVCNSDTPARKIIFDQI